MSNGIVVRFDCNSGAKVNQQHACLHASSEAWQRQLPFLTCPLNFEDGKLFCRVTVGDDERWEEKTDIQRQARWLFVEAEG